MVGSSSRWARRILSDRALAQPSCPLAFDPSARRCRTANAASTPSINLPVDVSSTGSVAERSEMPSDCRCERNARWSYLSRAKRVRLNTTTKCTRPLFNRQKGADSEPKSYSCSKRWPSRTRARDAAGTNRAPSASRLSELRHPASTAADRALSPELNRRLFGAADKRLDRRRIFAYGVADCRRAHVPW